MGLIAVTIAVALLIALRLSAPKRHIAHAARVKLLDGRIVDRFIERGPIFDENGMRISLANKEIFVADGNSMSSNNIPAGATCIAEKLDDNARLKLNVGDIVVLDAPTVHSETGLRFRKIAGFEGSIVKFEAHNPRERGLIRAKVTHVLA